MGYAYDESPFVPFNTPQVGPTVPSLPSPDMRDAEIAKLRSALAAARAALDGEMELHDETQRALNLGIEFAFDAADGRPGIETACEVIAKYDARRAAEANGEPK